MRFPPLLLLLAAALSAPLAAQHQGKRAAIEHYDLDKKNLAIDGYDPVAYFPAFGGAARKGDKKIVATHRGVTYRFANERNRKAFLAAPASFEPTYGGWCAWAMADGKGEKVEPSAKSFTIENGRLYLFYDGFFADTRKKWNKRGGAPKLAGRADTNWRRISGELPPRDLTHWSLDSGLALSGFDPVEYVANGKAVTGKPEHTLAHRGVTYRFASDANLETFAAAPENHEARYGGWCAWAMSQGSKVAVDPEAFLVEDGRLLLFESKSVRELWRMDAAALRGEADTNWARLQR